MTSHQSDPNFAFKEYQKRITTSPPSESLWFVMTFCETAKRRLVKNKLTVEID
jgi:hypothetical protein